MIATITPTEHAKAEWARFAIACYANGRNDLGHHFSALSAMRSGLSIDSETYDAAQEMYRAWLCFNHFPAA
jgi:hypothetical protein